MIPTILIALQLASVNFNYSEAKMRADRSEAAMSDSLRLKLLSAQGSAIKLSFEKCKINRVQEPFTVVLHIGSNGRSIQSWRIGNSAFSKCVERNLSKFFYFEPTQEDFFTSFELSFNQATL